MNLNNLIDPGIINECRNGNMRNFRELVRATSPFIFSVAFRMLGDEERAKDAVQETMITVWDKISSLKSDSAFRIWMYRIVVNKCYDSIRKSRGQPEIKADEKTWAVISDMVSAGEDLQLENNQIASIIKGMAEKLSPKQKTVFILSELEELTCEEISVVTGMSRANIKANLHYARKSIGEQLKRYI